MTGLCPKCANDTWEGPRLVHHQNGLTTHNWPMQPMEAVDNWTGKKYPAPSAPHPEALQYRCSRCGFNTYTATVERGGPIPTVPKRDAKERTADAD